MAFIAGLVDKKANGSSTDTEVEVYQSGSDVEVTMLSLLTRVSAVSLDV